MFTEFFCGIGGLSVCLPPCSSALSIDINRNALAIHELNFPHRRLCKTIESLRAEDLAEAPGELWWMSPPCQPFTRRGLQRDLDDPRSDGFRNMLTLIRHLRPENTALENVPEFIDSDSRRLLLQVLQETGYQTSETVLCATDFGSINRRRRYYLAASLNSLAGFQTPRRRVATVRLQPDIDHVDFAVPNEWLVKYETAMHLVDENSLNSGQETTTCFTSAYGRSPVHSGSYLRTHEGVRFFTPHEILWQLGFPAAFQLPDWPPEKLWPLTGNTLVLPAVRYLLTQFELKLLSPVQPQTPL